MVPSRAEMVEARVWLTMRWKWAEGIRYLRRNHSFISPRIGQLSIFVRPSVTIVFSFALAGQRVESWVAARVWPRNLVGASVRHFVAPSVSWKLHFGSTWLLLKDRETHFDGFSDRPRPRQAESITKSEPWWSWCKQLMMVRSSAKALALCSWPRACSIAFGAAFGGLGRFSVISLYCLPFFLARIHCTAWRWTSLVSPPGHCSTAFPSGK